MRVNDNGVMRDMTASEIAEWEELTRRPTEPNPEQRIAQLEEALELLLSGVTE